jgi:hypothetical protein
MAFMKGRSCRTHKQLARSGDSSTNVCQELSMETF